MASPKKTIDEILKSTGVEYDKIYKSIREYKMKHEKLKGDLDLQKQIKVEHKNSLKLFDDH